MVFFGPSVVSGPFFSDGSANAVESGLFSGIEGMVADLADEERALSMGSLMPLSGVSSAEHLVTDTAAVGLPRHRWILQVGSSYHVTGFSSLSHLSQVNMVMVCQKICHCIYCSDADVKEVTLF